jgi:hypothetical protein
MMGDGVFSGPLGAVRIAIGGIFVYPIPADDAVFPESNPNGTAV